MFGYKLIKKKELVKIQNEHALLFNAYKTICNRLDEKDDDYWDVKRDNAELQALICEYAEALEEQTDYKNKLSLWCEAVEFHLECLKQQRTELKLVIVEYSKALEQQTREKKAMPASYKELYEQYEELRLQYEEVETVLDSYRMRARYEATKNS